MPNSITRTLATLQAWLRARIRNDDRGQAVAEVLMYTGVIVVAIVALGVLMEALGADVIERIRELIGLD